MKSIEEKKNITLESIAESMQYLATKEDLKGFATKEDLKNFATREDLRILATKDDLKGHFDLLLKKIDDTNEQLDNLAIVTKNQFDHIDNKIDSLEQKVDRIDSRLTAGMDYIMLHYSRREEMKQIDLRVKRLERKIA